MSDDQHTVDISPDFGWTSTRPVGYMVTLLCNDGGRWNVHAPTRFHSRFLGRAYRKAEREADRIERDRGITRRGYGIVASLERLGPAIVRPTSPTTESETP